MNLGGRDISPTRSTYLELQRELQLVREGHELLDQKRMLLAAELLRWRERYDDLRDRLVQRHEAATIALAEATARHGLDELSVTPAQAPAERQRILRRRAGFLGIPLILTETTALEPPAGEAGAETEPRVDGSCSVNPSPEARRCARHFSHLVVLAGQLAAVSGNIHRLLSEYRRTERKARALENVIAPELRQILRQIGEHLEEQEQQDLIRVRSAARRRGDHPGRHGPSPPR